MDKKKIEIKDLNLDVQPEKGFRKGVTKRSLIKSLSDEDWGRIDAMKEAEERKVSNDIAYKLFVRSDQLVLQKEQFMTRIRESIQSILELELQSEKNRRDITIGKTEQVDGNGISYTLEDLKLMNFKITTDVMKYLHLLRLDLSKLYTYVGKKGLDFEVIFNEKDYEDTVDWVQKELSNTKYKLL